MMKAETILAVFSFLFCWSQAAPAETAVQPAPTVIVKTGELRGVETVSGGAVFKGIPYAQPPVGDLRWREPLPAPLWTGVRDAASFGPTCVQGGNLGKESSEDCLYLNIWTPKWPMTKPVAVMVWIHGGGNFAGAGSERIFDGESLARHGVVLVTLNYRLGIFGFFAHPELTRESPHHVSGNYGLLDQVLALHWVHDNIAKFGGDPANVTIFGESAGSLDVNVLMTSPLSKGLYRRVIGESGPVVAPPALAEEEKKGQDVAAKLNVSGDSVLAKLRSISSADLQKATGQGLAFLGPYLGVNVDGYIFPESPMKTFVRGREQKADLLLGSNSQELQRPFFPMTGGLREAIAVQFGVLSTRALELYSLGAASEPAPDPRLGPVMAQWATDTQFRCGSVAELIWHANAQNSAYQFQFSRSAPDKETLGAPHGSEVAFVFGTLDTQTNPPHYTEADHKLSETMQQYWTNFAKTGNPNGPNLPTWPSFNSKDRAYMELTNSGAVADNKLRGPICDLYREMFEHKVM